MCSLPSLIRLLLLLLLYIMRLLVVIIYIVAILPLLMIPDTITMSVPTSSSVSLCIIAILLLRVLLICCRLIRIWSRFRTSTLSTHLLNEVVHVS